VGTQAAQICWFETSEHANTITAKERVQKSALTGVTMTAEKVAEIGVTGRNASAEQLQRNSGGAQNHS
jgi:hypothetical protein